LRLGAVRAATGKAEDALDTFQRSATAARKLGDRRGEARALEGIALALRTASRTAEADDFQRMAVTAYRALGDIWSTAVALESHARDLDSAGSHAQARVAREEALASAADFDDPAALRLAQTLRTALGDPGPG